MATSRFSLTLFWPMNSCRRCGRSLSSKEESSSTGAAETRRSLRFGLSLAADTEGDGSSSEFWVASWSPGGTNQLSPALQCVRENGLSRRIHMTTRVDSSRCRSVRFVRWSWCQSPGKQPSQIIGNGRQRELGRHFGLSLGAELPHPPLLLQHSKHRFHQGLPFCVHSSSRRAAQLLPHRLQLWTAHPVASDGTRPFPGVHFACQVRVRHIHLDTTFF